MQGVRGPLRALIVCLALLGLGGARGAPRSRSRSRSRRSSPSHGLDGGGTGVTIVDLANDAVTYRYHAWKRLTPASNEKLITTVAALATLRPGFRYETSLSGGGTRNGAAYDGDIYLVGAGDPTLTTAGLDTLAKRLYQSGVRHITGRILGDESIFDKVRFGPQWKHSFYGTESPPLSGLTVNRNTAAERPHGALPRARRREADAARADRAGHHGRRQGRDRPRAVRRATSSARTTRSRSGRSCASWTRTATTSSRRW